MSTRNDFNVAINALDQVRFPTGSGMFPAPGYPGLGTLIKQALENAPSEGFQGFNSTYQALIGIGDNSSSLRCRGPQHAAEGGADVQSYAGIFYNDGYDIVGTLKTRFIIGANLEMDMAIQAPHQLQIVAGDATQADGELYMSSKTMIRLLARANSDAPQVAELLVDRVDQGSVDGANTSDMNINVSAGNLRLMSGNVSGAPILPSLSAAEIGALTGVNGMIVVNSDTNKLNVYLNGGWEVVTSA